MTGCVHTHLALFVELSGFLIEYMGDYSREVDETAHTCTLELKVVLELLITTKPLASQAYHVKMGRQNLVNFEI